VFAVGVGNALEFYDFLTYSFFAIQIGHTFFPAEQTSHGLLFSLATFGVGFVTRPLGGVVLGAYSDRAGRRPAMVLSFLIMGVAITGLALTPGYARIGPLAPVLLVVFRLAQGFALGGEVGPATAYLIEAAPPNRRGLYVAIQFMTQDAAVLAAGLVGFCLSSWLDPAGLDSWGWRVAFLLGVLVVPVGLVIRARLPETHVPEQGGAAGAVPARVIVLGLAMLAGMTIVVYSLDYLATYTEDALRMTPRQGLLAVVVIGLCTVTVDPITGLLCDRFGRRPVMLSAAAVLLATIVPAFRAMVGAKGPAAVYGCTAVLSALSSLVAVPTLITVTEALPRQSRGRTLGTLYAVAIAAFGGTTQFGVKWLSDATGSTLAPAWYMTGGVLVGAIAVFLSAETAPRCVSAE
jgi:MFS family permease